ncbi:hypothetical protein NK718_21270, partial [Alsobacter sp. SYSU M60028]|nr:hypothetical protein [Alsobacter ponti]
RILAELSDLTPRLGALAGLDPAPAPTGTEVATETETARSELVVASEDPSPTAALPRDLEEVAALPPPRPAATADATPDKKPGQRTGERPRSRFARASRGASRAAAPFPVQLVSFLFSPFRSAGTRPSPVVSACEGGFRLAKRAGRMVRVACRAAPPAAVASRARSRFAGPISFGGASWLSEAGQGARTALDGTFSGGGGTGGGGGGGGPGGKGGGNGGGGGRGEGHGEGRGGGNGNDGGGGGGPKG